MTRQRIIELANWRTGRVGEKKLDLDGEFLGVLQEFCAEYRWYWRKRSVSFATVAGVATYDLGATQADAPDQCIDALDCEEIISVKLFSAPKEYTRLIPLFDTDSQDEALEDDSTGKPGHYFIEPGSSRTLRITPIPDDAYRLRISFWAMPNTTADTQSSSIPLVPGYLHRILVKGLEAQIFRYVLGDASKQYLGAKAEYEATVARAAEKRDFAVGKAREWTSSEEAIRSY
jgi:hypothetical protein